MPLGEGVYRRVERVLLPLSGVPGDDHEGRPALLRQPVEHFGGQCSDGRFGMRDAVREGVVVVERVGPDVQRRKHDPAEALGERDALALGLHAVEAHGRVDAVPFDGAPRDEHVRRFGADRVEGVGAEAGQVAPRLGHDGWA